MDDLNDDNILFDDSVYQQLVKIIEETPVEDFEDLPISSSTDHPPSQQVQTPQPDLPTNTHDVATQVSSDQLPQSSESSVPPPLPITISIKDGEKINKLAIEELKSKIKNITKITAAHRRHLKSLENSIVNTTPAMMDILKEMSQIIKSLEEMKCDWIEKFCAQNKSDVLNHFMKIY